MSASLPERDLPLAEELATVFTQMSGLLLSQETVETALHTIATLAQTTLPGTVAAGLTLVDVHGRRTTAGASDRVTQRADALQYELDEGPCLTACAQRTLVRVDDVAHDERWPRWARAVRPLGVYSTLSAPLVAGDTTLGAIKVYGQHPGIYDAHAEHVMTLFAAQAAVLVANVQTVENARSLSTQLRDALRNRDVISTAKGVLMAREGVDEDTAFARLVAMSQRDGRKLRDVAETLVRAASQRRR
ncbi:GAF and ANTAR domain-containing protein [Cellulomonas fengjieae]|uniref:GAF and ANTAR domain-containing protein n=1 Tax=Cellulomonas fengjieae TaxID=2819978 RepID=A0ABS3SIA7_9CELL|nr:GAF and ANTAR domain-containing protein [Cellulomonas fengjieae]MBO3085478.1 GAF and ANTAR domain-containing protein [Cellulomonas fengjieae]MBO3102562.1 GAF and ANTAR domain-containing protein [Cellulomonas fengjieae]QVI64475.1 GAF and ANTAR domain-containing protein [Cellulomonas fengjieae]